MTVRRALLLAHLWLGCLTAPFLIVLGLTGAVLVYEGPLATALNAPRLLVAADGPTLGLDDLAARSGLAVRSVALPAGPASAIAFDDGSEVRFLDPHTGRLLGTGAQMNGALVSVHRLHTQLLSGKKGAVVTAAAAIALLFLALSGLLLWWPRKIFTVRRDGTTTRLVFDLHSALGAYAWIFLLLFAFTAVVIHWDTELRAAMAQRFGGLQAPARPAATCAGKPRVGLQALVDSAQGAVPGATPTFISLGAGAEDPARVVLRYPEDHTPRGRTRVALEACTGKVVQLVSSRTVPLYERYISQWNRELHTGDFLGWPTRLLACLFSLSLPLLAVTGPLIWWTRRSRARAHLRRPGLAPALD